jgi:hypothetical protein
MAQKQGDRQTTNGVVMLNREAATTARNRLAKSVEHHKSHLENATTLSTELFELRRSSSHELVAELG